MELDVDINSSISQEIHGLTAGERVQLDFRYARSQFDALSGGLHVEWNGNAESKIVGQQGVWDDATYSFIAVAGTNTLKFVGRGPDNTDDSNDKRGGVIDDIVLRRMSAPNSGVGDGTDTLYMGGAPADIHEGIDILHVGTL
jgi:hypothetical protein